MRKLDTQLIGFLFGLIGPVIGGIIYYFLQFSHMGFNEYIRFAYQSDSLDEIISLSTLFNLAIFFLFINLKFDKTSRGVIIATFLYVLIVILLKFG